MDRLNELLQELGLSKVKLAKYLGVSRQMVYNYLVLDSLDKWPKEKKVLLLQLLDIKDGSKKSIESIVVDTDYLMEVEKRLNTAIKQTNSIESVIDMNGLTKENKQLLNDFIFLLKEKLENVVNSTFIRIDHKEAIDLLKNSGEKWEFEPSYEEDIAKEHERWLTNYFSVPVFIKNWPAGIKAYYMKLNEDGKTVAGVDLEVPGAGELIGGSQREEKLDVLLDRMKELGVEEESIEWYVNLRRYGGCIHSGFGMGFERLIMYLTGIENIRDVIPYPRTPGSCEF